MDYHTLPAVAAWAAEPEEDSSVTSSVVTLGLSEPGCVTYYVAHHWQPEWAGAIQVAGILLKRLVQTKNASGA